MILESFAGMLADWEFREIRLVSTSRSLGLGRRPSLTIGRALGLRLVPDRRLRAENGCKQRYKMAHIGFHLQSPRDRSIISKICF